ncbi:MAK10-like protein, partial [Tanacetum coccineum]
SHHGIDLWLQIQIFYDHVNPIIRRTIDQAAGGKLREKNNEESWELLEDLAFYDNKSWNDPRNFAKPVKAISMPHDVPSTSDRRMIELEDQIKLTDEKLVETDVRLALASNSHIYPLGVAEYVLVEVTGFVYLVDFMILDIKEDVKKPMILGTPFLTTARAKIKFNKRTISLRSGKRTEPRNKEVIKSPTKLLAPKYHEQPSSIMIDEKTPSPRRVYFVNTTTLVKKERESRDTTPREHEGLTSEVDDEVGNNELEKEEEDDLEYFNTFPSMKELEYHKWLLKNPRPP